MGSTRSRGFTLVELLVVISIIGILIMLLMPAVQSAQESGRRTQCKNNLKNVGLGMLQHLEKQGFFPTGGWGRVYAGDPTKGYSRQQPGGWSYNILNFIEQQNLHDYMGAKTDTERRANGRVATGTPIAVYICPTRRRVAAYPFLGNPAYTNIDSPQAIGVGRIDYAMCAGDQFPSSINDNYGAPPATGTESEPQANQNGLCYLWSQVTSAAVQDGLGNTYLVGEKCLDSDRYYSGNAVDDDQGWNVGYDFDNIRWVNSLANEPTLLPKRDRPGQDARYRFGSPHPAGWNVVLCDGSVRTMNYSADALTHHCLGVRNDHTPIDQSKLSN